MAENTKRKSKSVTAQLVESLEQGKMPPQAAEMEQVVIGAVLIEKDAVLEIADFLKPEMFYKEAHQHIYRAALHLSQEHQPIDLITITDKLRKEGLLEQIGGPAFIVQLTNSVASAAHLEFHARIIAQKYIQRELIRVATEIQNKAFDPGADIDDVLNFSEKSLFEISYGNVKREAKAIEFVVQDVIKLIEEAGKREDGLSGIPCGFSELDRMTAGWQRSDLVIVAARPSMGKTAFVLSMARNIAVNHKVPVAIFSLEMSSAQLVQRLVSSEIEIPADRIRTGKLLTREWEQLHDKVGALAKSPFFIDDTPSISLFELRAKARRLKMQHNIDLIIVDYLQLMTVGGDQRMMNREQEVSIISRGLKAIAKELNVPVIALSQLNRSVETRGGDRRPQLSDLRESGAIEQDADIVLFIHRPERFGILEDEEGNSTKGLAQIIVAKHRNGEVGDVRLKFVGEFARFMDWDSISLETFNSELNPIRLVSKINDSSDMINNPEFPSMPQFTSDEEAPF